MLIGLTGTPGTGKTTVASHLSSLFDYIILSQNEIAFEHGYILDIDTERDSKNLDIDAIDSYIAESYLNCKETMILEGHATHFLTHLDYIFILRCRPTVLRKRLMSRDWSLHKIDENVEAEALDVITCEAADFHECDRLFEIDTTGLAAEEIARILYGIIESGFTPTPNYKIGNIDWSEEIF